MYWYCPQIWQKLLTLYYRIYWSKSLKDTDSTKHCLDLRRLFFGQRKNRIKLGSTDITSEWKDVKRGCPQGSAFALLLWNMFQNNMPLQVKNPNLYLYADDQLYAVNRLIQIGEKDLKEGVEAISHWYKKNLLKAYHEKYQLDQRNTPMTKLPP